MLKITLAFTEPLAPSAGGERLMATSRLYSDMYCVSAGQRTQFQLTRQWTNVCQTAGSASQSLAHNGKDLPDKTLPLYHEKRSHSFNRDVLRCVLGSCLYSG